MSTVHLGEVELQRLLDGELPPSAARSAREHVLGCGDCRVRAETARAEETRVAELLGRLDHPPPRIALGAVVAAARASIARERRGAWTRRAAAVLLALGAAGVAAAAPGSPLAHLVRRAIEGAAPARLVEPGPAESRVAAPEPGEQGIAVLPGERLTIVFASERPGGTAVVELGDGAEVAVRSIGGAATFTADDELLSIGDHGSAARFGIVVPRSAPRVDILVAGRRVFSKRAATILADGARDERGRYVVPLFQPGW